jgi:outer membrane protein assembly factor BamE (lipoprotein component of BamABCDE complex)
MRNMRRNFFAALIAGLVCLPVGLSSSANAQARMTQKALAHDSTIQAPLYSEYKGVRLGMTALEARAKLGTPALKASDQDYYVFSDNETAQIGYDAAQKVVTISVDYLNGIGAPDFKAVVGGELTRSTSGSMYRMVRYESLGFWVSYNRTPGPVPIVSITIQKMLPLN